MKITEKQLQEILSSFKHNTRYMTEDMALTIGSNIGALVAEVRRLKKIEETLPDLELEHKFMRARNERLELENERLEKALEHYVRNAQEDIA